MTRYEELLLKYGKCEGLGGIDEDGNFVIVTIDDESACIRTSQKNGWLRNNTYYPDGSSEETYQR
jgi:hypothetical protein